MQPSVTKTSFDWYMSLKKCQKSGMNRFYNRKPGFTTVFFFFLIFNRLNILLTKPAPFPHQLVAIQTYQPLGN